MMMQPLDHANAEANPDEEEPARRPRIGIMGEFSAGKSTLTNLLLGAPALPTKVTATQLPPVWLSYGAETPVRVGLDGQQHPVDLERIAITPVGETAHLRLFQEAPVLEMCDLIDMPGISDPNMSSEVWERMVPLLDGVIWCTHATQAWRQTEAAVWEELPEGLRAQSLLLLTRMDKLTSERDRQRVLARVTRETEGLFDSLYPVSLTEALAAGEDADAGDRSGVDAFKGRLTELLARISAELGGATSVPEGFVNESCLEPRLTTVANSSTQEAPTTAISLAGPEGAASRGVSDLTEARIVPRRVRLSSVPGRRKRARPSADAVADPFATPPLR